MADIYRFNPDMPPDSEFVAGSLDLIVAGNSGRALDSRRTPIRITDVRPATGFFVMEILDFEDTGAHWEMPFESVKGFQFARDSKRAGDAEAALYAETVRRLDQPLEVPVERSRRAATRRRLGSLQREAAAWIAENARYTGLADAVTNISRDGPERLRRDFEAYMADHDLLELERGFADQYVRNPYSGERVKGHRIVLAELGLVRFVGKAIRDPSLFDGRWSRSARAEHILRRLAFVRALFAAANVSHVVLYRGFSCIGAPRPPANDTFVSSTFDRDVALAHFDDHDRGRTGVLARQRVPIHRLFMTYLETGAMNAHYREAEAILFFEKRNRLF